jgi:transcriptional regulator
MAPRKSLLHGTLETLVLKALAGGPRHGYAIARWLEDTAGDAIKVEEGSLYPALYRMEKDGLLEAEWGLSELERRAKFYHLTAKGRGRLEASSDDLLAFTRAIERVLGS